MGGRDELVAVLSNSGRTVSVYETAKLQVCVWVGGWCGWCGKGLKARPREVG